jgi:hypothetical protein
MTDHEIKVEELVDNLGCSILEVEEIIKADKKIDKGEAVDFGLSKEEEKQALKYANVREHKKPAVYKFDKKERKADADKRHLIALLCASVGEVADNEPTITNIERQIDFEFKGRKFRIVLSAPRT